ncbi:MAG: hypothetical protein IK093_14535, partial [Ruminiclostridium sp.]|nr:hypothetical protein [Ruminiclostridium sp.]
SVGTVTGSGCTANIIRSSAVFCINAERLTGIGATEGSTRIFVRDSSVKTTGSGIKAIALGGFNEDTFISIGNSDVKAELRNKVNTALFARDDNVTIDKSRIRIVVNGVEEERSFNVIHERD